MNHYYKIALACVAVLFVSTPVMARGGSTICSSANTKPSETQRCLARMNDPAQVRARHEQDKRAHCEQNAKNQHLKGSAQSRYLASCMRDNDAAAALASVKQHRPAHASRPHQRRAVTHHRKQAGNSCVARANKAHLKGSKRRHFLKRCRH